MLKDKYKTLISIISIALSVFILIGYLIITPNTEEDILNPSQPEYMNKVFNKDKVSEIDITINEKDWKDLLENAMDEEYIIGDVTINGEKFSSVGIRPKGNSSLKMVASDDNTDRYSFKIDFHEYVKSQTYYGLEKLALNNCISDATYMKEYLSYELYSKMGIATPACSFVQVKINGEEWGLYLAVEVMEERFIERYFGSVDGNLYKPESTEAGGNPGMPNSDNSGTSLVYNGDDLSNYNGILDNAVFSTTNKKDNKKVIEMIKNLNEGTNLEKYLDVDEILRYFAVNTFLVNLDSYAGNLKHNYYLYERDGKFQILPWDLNLSFAGYEGKDGQTAINFPIDKPVTDTMENSPLISKLLEVEKYKETYHKYLNMIVTEYIDSGEYGAPIDKVNNLINEYVKNDPTAFYTYEEYQNSLPVLKQFGIDRGKSIMAQLKGEQPTTSYGTIETTVDLSKLGSMGGQGGKPPEDEKAKLEEIVKMKDKMPFDNNGNKNKDELKPRENMSRKNPFRDEIPKNNKNKDLLMILIISILVLVIGLIFVFKFK